MDKAYKEKAEPPPLADAATAHQGETAIVADLLLKAHIGTARSASEALQALGALPEFFAKTDDVLLPYLDALHDTGMDTNNHRIYLELTRKFERRFFEDMEALNFPGPRPTNSCDRVRPSDCPLRGEDGEDRSERLQIRCP